MAGCPKCLKEHGAGALVVAACHITCSCGWKGRSTEMIMNASSDGSFLVDTDTDPLAAAVLELRFFIAQQVGPQLAKKLRQLELIPSPDNPESVAVVARILRAGSHGFIKGILDQMREEYQEQSHETIDA